MGRYYSGDINGRFWFCVQSSDDASFFGGEEIEPNYLEYYFDGSHKDDITLGIGKCLEALGEWKEKLDGFFREHDTYNEARLIEAGIPVDKVNEFLVWYARLELGEKIRKCVEEKGECTFEAEL
jgi:hypothetical protein